MPRFLTFAAALGALAACSPSDAPPASDDEAAISSAEPGGAPATTHDAETASAPERDPVFASIEEQFTVPAHALAALSDEDRDDVIDLIEDINNDRRRARERLERAARAEERGDAERAADQRTAARASAEEAAQAAAEVAAILAGGHADDTHAAAAATTETTTGGDFALESARITWRLPDGERTIWFTDHGATVAMESEIESVEGFRHKIALWTDGRLYMHDLTTDEDTTSPLRLRVMEPTYFALTPAAQLEQSGAYERVGDDEILGRTCELWRYTLTAGGAGGSQGCKWRTIEMLWIDLDADGAEIRRREVVSLEEGVDIPARFLALAEE